MCERRAGNREQFAEFVRELSAPPGVTHSRPGSKTFGHSALKVNDKIFAMVSSSGDLVVKLPKARVDELEASRAGKRFEASQGRPMKEWVQVDAGSSWDWLWLAREALDFVSSL